MREKVRERELLLARISICSPSSRRTSQIRSAKQSEKQSNGGN